MTFQTIFTVPKQIPFLSPSFSTTGIGGRRILSKNQNNTSAEDGHFANSSSSSASGFGAARMDTSDATQSTSQSAFALHQQWTRRQPQQQQQQQQQMTGSSMILVNQRQMRKQQQQQRHQLHPQRQQQQQQQLWHQQQQQQQRHQIVGSGFPAQILKQIHGQNCNRNFNAESPCSCGNEKGKLRPDINSDISKRRKRK